LNSELGWAQPTLKYRLQIAPESGQEFPNFSPAEGTFGWHWRTASASPVERYCQANGKR
jgi:hypothetical protein